MHDISLFRKSDNLYSKDILGIKQGHVSQVHLSLSCIQLQRQGRLSVGCIQSGGQLVLRNIIFNNNW